MLRAVTDADPTATDGGRDRSLRPRAARSHVGKAYQHGRGAGYLALREDVVRQSVKVGNRRPFTPVFTGIQGALEEVGKSPRRTAVRILGRSARFANRIVSIICTVSSRMPSSGMQASICTRGRPEHGTDPALCTAWRSWVPRCGNEQG